MRPLSFVLPVALTACGGPSALPPPPPPPEAPAPPAAEPVATAPAPPPAVMPTACAGNDPSNCTPPSPFVDALCNGSFPDATLALFASGSPWTRAYLRGDVDGWYASGGGSARAKLLFDEEVLVLRVRAAATSGVVVSGGSASYDVLRWDGLCYTVDTGELTMKRPPKPKHPPLPFHHFADATQAALLADAKVLAAHTKRGKECHGVTTGDVTLACEQADRALGEAVIGYVLRGGTLPPPAKIPGG